MRLVHPSGAPAATHSAPTSSHASPREHERAGHPRRVAIGPPPRAAHLGAAHHRAPGEALPRATTRQPGWTGRGGSVRGIRSALREAIGDRSIDLIPCVGGVFRLNEDVSGSDYGRLAVGCDAAKQSTDPERLRAVLSRAADGIRGEAFAGADYNWLVEGQEHVRSLAIDALSTDAQLCANAGKLDAAIETLDHRPSTCSARGWPPLGSPAHAGCPIGKALLRRRRVSLVPLRKGFPTAGTLHYSGSYPFWVGV